jgi:GntR family transcriptional regulator
MVIRVDPNSGIPVYRQIVDQIRFQIGGGLLPPGTELPSTRALSRKLRVNPMTVSKSYALLEDEGVLERRPGLTLIVAELSPSKREHTVMQQLRAALEPAATIASQLGVPPRPAGALFREMVEKSDRDLKTETA